MTNELLTDLKMLLTIIYMAIVVNGFIMNSIRKELKKLAARKETE